MKRYETYKNSGVEWIGEIPEGWEVSKLKYLFDVVSGATPDSSNQLFWDGDIPWITPADYKTNDHFVEKGKRFITQLGYQSCSTTFIPTGSIVFSKRAPIGSVAITKTELCTNQGCLSCVPNNNADVSFYYYLMSIYTNAFDMFGAGTTFKEISATDFSNFPVQCPPLSEQQQISSYLDYKVGQIDSSLAKIVEQIEDLKSYRQIVISEAVTKGLNPNAKMKDSGVEWIGEIPEGWGVRNLKYLTEKIGSGVTPTGGAEVYQDHGVIFLRSQNIYPTGLKLSDVAYISEEIDERMCATRVKKGDVLLNITGASIGRCACYNIDDRANVNQHVCIIRPLSEQLYADFLQYVLNSNLGQNSINYVQNGANREGLNFEQIKKFSIPLPPLSEQQQIASYLDSKTSKIDSSIEALELQKSQLEDYKRSLISEAVTGKVDLRGWKTNKC